MHAALNFCSRCCQGKNTLFVCGQFLLTIAARPCYYNPPTFVLHCSPLLCQSTTSCQCIDFALNSSDYNCNLRHASGDNFRAELMVCTYFCMYTVNYLTHNHDSLTEVFLPRTPLIFYQDMNNVRL